MSKEKESNSNNLFDRILQGVAAFVMFALATHDVAKYIRADGNMKYALAAGFTSFLIYTMIAPLFRK